MSRSACNVRPIQQARLQCATIIIIFQHSHLSQLCVHNQLYFTGSWKYVWQLQLLPLRWLDTCNMVLKYLYFSQKLFSS